MTLPPDLVIPDDEFDKLHSKLSRIGFAVYLPTTIVTGAVFGGVLAIVIGGLIYLSGLVKWNLLAVAMLVSVCSAIIFAQRYAFHASQNLYQLLIGQIMTLIGFLLFMPIPELNSIFALIGFFVWVGIWIQICELHFLVAIQKRILCTIHRLSI